MVGLRLQLHQRRESVWRRMYLWAMCTRNVSLRLEMRGKTETECVGVFHSCPSRFLVFQSKFLALPFETLAGKYDIRTGSFRLNQDLRIDFPVLGIL